MHNNSIIYLLLRQYRFNSSYIVRSVIKKLSTQCSISMSHNTYDEEWRKTQNLLLKTIQSEPIQADRREHRQLLATLYIRYILISNRLSECVDQMVQPQKRLFMRRLLESVLGRILELKTDLVEADLNEWTHTGDILENLNLTPDQSEIKVPDCFRLERKDELDYKNGLISRVLSQLGFLDKPKLKPAMTEQQAILIIQVHERARQGRLRTQFMKEIRTMKDKTKPLVAEEDDSGSEMRGGISLPAALRIQKMWRGYVARRTTRRRKLQEMLLIGMIPPPKMQSNDAIFDLGTKDYRRSLQKQRQSEYEHEVIECRDHLEKYQRGVILEQLSDQVRGWLHDYKAQTGKLPEYTGSDRSPSRMLLSRQGTESEMSKSTQGSSKDSKMKKSTKSKDSKSPGGEEGEEVTTKATISTFLPSMNARKEEYDEIWKEKDESSNPHQYHYFDMIEHEQRSEMENELRKIVDDMMKTELQLLQEAMDKDRGFKGKKKSTKKARKGGKKSKKKKEKDLTPDRTTESLFEELVANGIIKQLERCPEVYLADFKAERSYHPPALHNKGKDPPVALGDVRQILAEYCVIPLLSGKLHEFTPHIKSLLLAGPKGSGKDMLVRAICTEAGALLFDLTPSNIVGKYPGKSGLTMLIHLVVKVSRLLQPAVIYMDCAERPFVKKIPKTDRSDPKRLKKDLPKIIKNFSPEDRVMLIGVSSCPWESDQKLLQQVYQKFLVVPKPDYSSRYCIWTHMLGQYKAISWQFDTSVMSKISDGYTAGSIIGSFEEVMTVKRVIQLRVHPLSPLELLNTLCKRTPIYKEEEEACEVWWSKTPMFRKRARAVEMLEEEEAEIQAKQASTKN